MVPAGEHGWTKKAESVSVFASRAFVTVTLAANIRGGMWTQIVYEGKSDRVHRHGPHFPCQLVSHSPTHWITQEAYEYFVTVIDLSLTWHTAANAFTLWSHHGRDFICTRGPTLGRLPSRREHVREVPPSSTQCRTRTSAASSSCTSTKPMAWCVCSVCWFGMFVRFVGMLVWFARPQNEECSQSQVPVNVVIWTLQPSGEEGEAVVRVK